MKLKILKVKRLPFYLQISFTFKLCLKKLDYITFMTPYNIYEVMHCILNQCTIITTVLMLVRYYIIGYHTYNIFFQKYE